MQSTLERRYRESEWTKEERQTGLIGKTYQVKSTGLSYINSGFERCWFPTRCMTEESFRTFSLLHCPLCFELTLIHWFDEEKSWVKPPVKLSIHF